MCLPERVYLSRKIRNIKKLSLICPALSLSLSLSFCKSDRRYFHFPLLLLPHKQQICLLASYLTYTSEKPPLYYVPDIQCWSTCRMHQMPVPWFRAAPANKAEDRLQWKKRIYRSTKKYFPFSVIFPYLFAYLLLFFVFHAIVVTLSNNNNWCEGLEKR